MRRVASVLLLIWSFMGIGAALWAQANNPPSQNAAQMQGPDPTGNQGYPFAVVGAPNGDPVRVNVVSGGSSSVTQGTSPWLVAGLLLNNNAVPGSNNLGVLGAIANASPPSWTEGYQTGLSVDLAGNLRVVTTGGGGGGGGSVTQGTSPWVVGFNGVAQPVSQNGTWTVEQGTPPWLVSQSGTWNVGLSAGSNTIGKVDQGAGGASAWTVDGSAVTQPVSGTFWQATQPVSGTVTANAGSGTFTVGGTVTANAGSGTFTVDGSGHTQPVSGTVTADQGGAPWSVGGAAASGAADSGNPIKVGGVFNTTQPTVTNGQRVDAQSSARGELFVAKGASGFSIDNTGFNVNNSPTVNQGTGGSSAWKVDGSSVTQPVSGTFWQATQPISGTVTANQGGTWTVQPGNTANTTAWKVDGSAVTQPVSGTFWQATQPVSGTVTANAGTGTFTVDGSGHTQPVSGTVTANAGTGTFTVAGAKTNNNAAPGAINVGTLPAVANAAAPLWTEGNQVTLSTDLAGNLRTSGTSTVSGTVTVNAGSGTFTVGGTVTANAGTGTFTVDGSGHTQPVSGTVTANQGGTWTVQPGNTANTTAWKVDGSAVTQPVSGTITANQGGAPWSAAGAAAHGGVISANPLRIAARSANADITQTGNGQTTDVLADLAGKLIVLPYTFPENFESGKTADVTTTGATSVIATAGVGVRNYITQVTIINSHATVNTWVNITDGSGGTVLYTAYCQNSGGGVSATFPVPLRTSANTALFMACETTGANVRVSASGYKAP